MIETLWQDVRYGFRRLSQSPGFTAVVVLCLALGIGANSVIFSLINAVLLHPLPFKNLDQLVMVWESSQGAWSPVSAPDFADWREQNQVFEQMAAYHRAHFNLTGGAEPERVRGAVVSAALFPLLGITPALGRAFLPEEEEPGRSRVVLISHGLWRQRFGGDPSLLGQALQLDGESYTVVGILPAHFWFPTKDTEVWVPLVLDETNRARRTLHVMARLKPEMRLEQARAEMATIARRLAAQYPKTNADIGVTLVPLREYAIGDARSPVLVLLGAVMFVLLIACANVANLLLVRATGRQKEMAIRAAMGASRWRLVRQLLTESVLLAMLGGAGGLLLAAWGVEFLVEAIPQELANEFPAAREIRLDGQVLGFTLVVSLLTGLIFGLAPARQASRLDLIGSLKEGGESWTVGQGRQRLRRLLVISEVALALVLLVGAGLMIQSFLRLQQVDPGFDPEHVLTMQLSLPETKYTRHSQAVTFYERLLEGLEALPGIQVVGLSSGLPLAGGWSSVSFSLEGRPGAVSGEEGPWAHYQAISPDYFRTMGISILRGRTFKMREDRGTSGVVILSESLARRFWPDQNPLGQRLKLGGPESRAPWLSIVGVVRDVRRHGLSWAPSPCLYVPYWQQPGREMFLVVRTAAEPLQVVEMVRQAVWAVDEDQPVSRVRSMEQLLSDWAAPRRLYTILLSLFAGMACLLAVVGIYGVMAYWVSQRRREMGLRMALGAEAHEIRGLVLREGMILTLMGVGVGMAGALALTRIIWSALFLYGVSQTDLMSFVGVPLLLVGIALVACYVPARRATKVDPMVALRYE